MSTTAKRMVKGRKAFMAATAVAAAAGAIVLPVQGAAAAETGTGQACTVEKLPIPDGLLFTFTTGMSDDGSVVAYRAYPAGNGDERFPLLYSDGEVTEVPIPGLDQQIADVNSSGDGAGYGFLGEGGAVPYAWRDGALVELANADSGQANGINEHGDIVGTVAKWDGEAESELPVIWPAGETEPVALPLPEGAGRAGASEIGDDGVVVGDYENAEGVPVPYMWDADGKGSHLPMPEGVDPETAWSYASDLQGDWASGYLETPELGAVGVVWNLAEGTAHVTGLEGRATVNAEGTAAGETFPNAAFQPRDGKVVELPGAWDPADNYFGDTADQISADGSTIAGSVYVGEDADGWHVLNAVVWTCA
ncbi:hypothetical protein [Glycomyces harbinensis]|uniref:Uncharacterized protein n=1 Tax=Glycomyces harbinensis TaxID=58114 RepID=A0A1G6Z2T4_9ACTN|nr:hypothetical protein [Glycomyces harbinensis]SDD96930.1 hypothetical protein SAMN05216270_11022 [Glycomyces harbinensis]